MPDDPRPAATGRDTSYSITIDEAAEAYARAGHPRTLRTLQRYCASGHLDCVKAATAFGDKYFVSPQSITRHLAQIEELTSFEDRATDRDLSRPGATATSLQNIDDQARHDATRRDEAPSVGAVGSPTPTSDGLRPAATASGGSSQPDAATAVASEALKARLEGEVERLHDDIDFLKQQIGTKDEQIAALLERDKETNFLVRGLQQMLSPLLSGPRQPRSDDEPPRF